MAGPTALGILKKSHPRLDLFHVRKLRALYKGGKALLGDAEVMRAVFPKHALESEASYTERQSRAFYDNDFALIVNKVVAGLAQDPLIFDDASGPTGTDKGRKEIPPFWMEMQKDSTPPNDDGEAKTFDQIIRETVTEGLVCGWGWMLCDLPPPDPAATSLADQEQAKLLRSYPVPHRADQVLNWGERGTRIQWVRTYGAEQPADEPETADREWTVHTWKVWDALTITTYQLRLNKDGKDEQGHEWKDEDIVPTLGEPMPHSFKRVPWVRFDCSAENEPQMHIGDMIESSVRSLFNAANADEFHRLRHAFQQLYEFLGSETPGPDRPVSVHQEDENRASRSMRNRAPDVVQIRGQDDSASFVSPDTSGVAINRQALTEKREALPRVTGQLALAADTSGAMIRRSGESKAQDKIAEEVVMGAVGKKAIAFARSVAEMLAIGRGDPADSVPPLRGYEHFDTEDSAARVEEHVALATAQIKSATFQIEHQLLVAIGVLGDQVTPEIKANIRKDLEATITQDSINQANMPTVPDGHELDPVTGEPRPIQPEPKVPPAKAKSA